MDHKKMILVGGWCMVIFSALFVGITIITGYLASESVVAYTMERQGLFAVVVGSKAIQGWLVVFALLPLLLVPAAVATYYAFQQKYEANMRVGMYFATLGASAFSLSLMLLPSFNWQFTSVIPSLGADQQPLAIAVLRGMHYYFGMYVGDVLGFTCILIWLFITSMVTLKTNVLPKAIGWISLTLVLIIFVILFSRYTHLAPTIHGNIQVGSLLALWFFIFGISLISLRKV